MIENITIFTAMTLVSSFILGIIAGIIYFIISSYLDWKRSKFGTVTRYSFTQVYFPSSLVLWILFKRNTPKRKEDLGILGEYLTFRALEEVKGYGKILTNLYIPCGEVLEKTEIDALLIHEYGIYIVESKNVSGYISGRLEDEKWIQRFWSGKHYSFVNPIKQNQTHKEALLKLLNPKYHTYVWSFVTFSLRCKLGNVPYLGTYVFKRDQLTSKIEQYPISRITPEEVDKIYKSLEQYSCVSDEEKTKHIKQILKIHPI